MEHLIVFCALAAVISIAQLALYYIKFIILETKTVNSIKMYTLEEDNSNG
jgi:hypothetical protein